VTQPGDFPAFTGSDAQLSRYSRHILLDGIGIEGQAALAAAHVLIIGAGGLGCPAAMYLAASGVGQLSLVDHDAVDLTNLQRQIAHRTHTIGQPKVSSLAQTCAAINPEVRIHTHAQRADVALLDALVPQVDVILDCTDGFEIRHAINAASLRHRVPLVSAAAVRMDAQATVFDPRRSDSPCYACIYPAPQAGQAGEAAVDEACATLGVLAPLVGAVGSLQAAQAIALITACAPPLVGQLLLWDAQTWQTTRIKVSKKPSCPVCGSQNGA
jgi:molybdopterin-synthase adenylyltransferase